MRYELLHDFIEVESVLHVSYTCRKA